MIEKRKKTDEENTFSVGRENTTVVCKLSRVCKVPDLLAGIRNTSIVLKQVQLEAWHIANLHVLRCLVNNMKLPTLDQMFFGWCCQGARATRIRKAKPKTAKEIKLDRQRNPKRPVGEGLRETVRLYRSERENIKGYTHPLPFEYDNNIMLEIASKMRVNVVNMVVLHFKKRLHMCARLLLEEKIKDKVSAPEVSRLVQACYGGVAAEGSEQERHPAFLSSSVLEYYSATHIVIDGSTLQGFCARIFKKTEGRNPLDILLTKSGKVLIPTAEVCKLKELYMHRAFAISQFETMSPNVASAKQEFTDMNHETKSLYASRLFTNQITTNGYSASMLLSQPKLVSKTSKIKLRAQQTKTEEVFGKEWRFLPEGYEANALVTIDPGMRSLCTAVSEGMKTKKEKTTHGGRPSRHVGAGTIQSISTKEYRHVAGKNKARFWHENLKKRKKRYASAIDSISLYKTSSYEQYLGRLSVFWQHVNFLIEFSADNAFLKWRFFQSRMKEMAMDAIAKRLVPAVSPSVLVGYGDWSRRNGISDHASSPVKGLQKALKKRVTVVPMDKYRINKLCLVCHSPLEQAFLLTKSIDQEAVSKKTRNVLRCASSDCKATFWDRDVNTPRNILALLKCKLLGLGGLEAFCRG